MCMCRSMTRWADRQEDARAAGVGGGRVGVGVEVEVGAVGAKIACDERGAVPVNPSVMKRGPVLLLAAIACGHAPAAPPGAKAGAPDAGPPQPDPLVESAAISEEATKRIMGIETVSP